MHLEFLKKFSLKGINGIILDLKLDFSLVENNVT